ncbi:DUF6510 family protein [Oerskovia flava]|uniref:DUF6510 family protein n=1 Tax=Oerskovia flava TaxID=2986422 RepID=UPI00223F67BC|nr:DUF6510 family protein [Oerskovia sp. JB1-3-2]
MQDTTGAQTHEDGNALAGPLSAVFAHDMTTAVGRCLSCAAERPLAEVSVWSHGPGLVARCPGCDAVLLRLVRTPRGSWLDMTGLSRVLLPV